MNDRIALLGDVARYYAGKLAEHGCTPKGVDWNDQRAQVLRFEMLCRFLPPLGPISVNDLGCGFGAILDYLAPSHEGLEYTGIDVEPSMVFAARHRHAARSGVRFVVDSKPRSVADYGLASGIFNVRLNHSDAEWTEYIRDTLDAMNDTSNIGFAFNCLTSYSDADRMRPDLFYADPCAIFDWCKRRYSRHVAVLHDYDLYEFTVYVRKRL